jgi:adenine deaminase
MAWKTPVGRGAGASGAGGAVRGAGATSPAGEAARGAAAAAGQGGGQGGTYSNLEQSLRRLYEANARIVLCGDTGFSMQAPGFTEHRELKGLADAGMPPLQAIRAATQVGAEALGLKDRGTLARGKRADFMVLDANPIENMANSRRIHAVYHDGIAVDRAALRASWAGAEGAVAPR